jgi:hypothetical protein
MTWSLRLALAACVFVALNGGARPARATEPGVRSELYNGMARITLEGSYVGARYTVRRADMRERPFQVLGEQNALCTGDCTILDPGRPGRGDLPLPLRRDRRRRRPAHCTGPTP